ncbi:MAG: LytTR family DNA-binding domain-containing protein, partial [Chitinophagaceae bacterium]
MNKILSISFKPDDRKALSILGISVLVLVLLALAQDLVQSRIENLGYYFSESFLFSSFWWLFLPGFSFQYFQLKYSAVLRPGFICCIILFPIFAHLFSYPLLVWILSGIFPGHTFSYTQTLRYTLSNFLYILLFMYSMPVLMFVIYRKKTKSIPKTIETAIAETPEEYPANIFVQEGYKKSVILIDSISHVIANPPYINIYVENKKFLYTETLKSFSAKLDPASFVRIHKSAIINLHMVDNFSSRGNGDYDLRLKDDSNLRISRNYAAV